MAKDYPSITIPPPGPRARAVIDRDAGVMSQNYRKDYPLVAARGRGPVVEDADGNRYLDFAAGIAVVATGHCHPEVVAAIKAQAERLLHICATDFYYENLVALAEGLARQAPGPGPWRVFFANSGAEVVEAAIKLARLRTGRAKIVAFYGAFHGRTYGALSLTASKPVQRKGYGPLLPEVLHSHYAYCYRCPVNREPKTCRVECLDLLTQTMFGSTVDPREVAAVIVEPIQGEGGYVVPHPGFLKRLREVTREHGILLIADEVQCGMGRTGRFFASQHFGLEPDLVAVAKGIASGMPLGALIARADVMQWESGGHGSTFGGNPVSVAAALATLKLLEGGLVANADAVGAHLMGRLRDRLASHPAVGDIRGLGLMIGVEIVEGGREPAPELRERILKEAFRRGLLLLGCGKSTIRLAPPLVIDGEDADIAVTILEESIRAVARAGG
ncbi:MAG TPA: acetyl ornithine aminotransferase family protein [Vicinamibacteria bacterium]|jgi:4-aminobutyrate aminotransferase|nr:acetyl ornithine aminotransferase family protein [Vicinamibacteria bacterium]